MTKEIEVLIKRSFLRDVMLNVLKNDAAKGNQWQTGQILRMLENMDEELKNQ